MVRKPGYQAFLFFSAYTEKERPDTQVRQTSKNDNKRRNRGNHAFFVLPRAKKDIFIKVFFLPTNN